MKTAGARRQRGEAARREVLSAAALERLQRELDQRSRDKSRAFWERYLKGEAVFRGVPMSGVRAAVHPWWGDEGLAELSVARQKRIALRLIEERPTEDKLAGVLALSEILLPHLSQRDLPAFARLFAGGHLADWNISDWFSVKVLGKMLAHSDEPAKLARAISRWRSSKSLWQRRATCVAFVKHAQHGDSRIPGLSQTVIDNCESLVADPARFAQTGVGWVLRELSRSERRKVIDFVERKLWRMSREAIKAAVAKLPGYQQKPLLRRHARAWRRGAPSEA
ncbi:MAG: DNA alkylation repair protein [Deltaproteobacteria bacterium]|jgi:3-methyladenine DNA glycosylase AlkD|nr:DNA alkylation repair protein [Deltaproteobacteria bacterium]MBW2532507.1 DNA alkylation repair protein [Deltaproteobacteria bacterium]